MDTFKYVLGVTIICVAPICIAQYCIIANQKAKRQNRRDGIDSETDEEKVLLPTTSGCPFSSKKVSTNGSSKSANDIHNAAPAVSAPTKSSRPNPRDVLAKYKAENPRVIGLYEEYVHLPQLRHVWTNPVTAYPRVEPYFAAACHGMELGYLLIADFVRDARQYLVKQPRIEMVCSDILTQCQLLADLLDGELDDTTIKVRKDGSGEDIASSVAQISVSVSTTPFTAPLNKAAIVSPGLQILHSAMVDAFHGGKCSADEQKTLQKVLRSLINAFHLHFGSFHLGLGIEHQINMLGEVAGVFDDSVNGQGGVPRLPERPLNLDYAILVRPQVCCDSFLKEKYTHTEDFFFRTVHLGTECWAFIAISRIDAAKSYAAKNLWNQAAAQTRYAAKIMNYLGDHVFLLTAMVIRDYLQLKVEIQGTSGEGSLAVKSFRTHLLTLLECLAGNLLGFGMYPWDQKQERHLYEVLAYIYAHPAEFPGLYDFAKSLESIESALLGGFYYKHYLLAKNVIGSYAKGTMERMVGMLKMTFEVPCYPILDEIRGKLGVLSDKQYEHNRAKIMNEIEAKHPYIPKVDTKGVSAKREANDDEELKSSELTTGQIISICMRSERPIFKDPEFMMPSFNGRSDYLANPISTNSMDVSDEDLSPEYMARDRNRRSMYSSESVFSKFQTVRAREMTKENIPELQFLDHAFGAVPPQALESTLEYMYAMYAGFGNFSWDRLFGEALPEAAGHIKRLLGVAGALEDDWKPTVEFGHNSHELVTRILSSSFDRLLSNTRESGPIRIITTDTEFFSLTRQMNRFLEGANGTRDKIDIQVVPVEPVATFLQRLEDCIRLFPEGSVDYVYVSQITYSQQTLIFDLPVFVSKVRDTLGHGKGIIMVDGYHGFGALPTNLTKVDVIYISGVLKHVGSGANLAFAVIPPTCPPMRPLLTGWLADISVLGPGSGISIGSGVGYSDGLSLMGSTPSFQFAVELFNRVMRLWQFHHITVSFAHIHVVRLHRKFLSGLDVLERQGFGHKFINTKRLMTSSAQPDSGLYNSRSHSLVFLQDKPEDGAEAVAQLRLLDIAIDCRKSFVRIGFGLNHNPEDVCRLLDALKTKNKI